MHWSEMSGVGPVRNRLMKHAEACGNDPEEAWQEVKKRMADAFTPENPELVVHTMYEAVTDYVKTSMPLVIIIEGVAYELKRD